MTSALFMNRFTYLCETQRCVHEINTLVRMNYAEQKLTAYQYDNIQAELISENNPNFQEQIDSGSFADDEEYVTEDGLRNCLEQLQDLIDNDQ